MHEVYLALERELSVNGWIYLLIAYAFFFIWDIITVFIVEGKDDVLFLSGYQIDLGNLATFAIITIPAFFIFRLNVDFKIEFLFKRLQYMLTKGDRVFWVLLIVVVVDLAKFIEYIIYLARLDKMRKLNIKSLKDHVKKREAHMSLMKNRNQALTEVMFNSDADVKEKINSMENMSLNEAEREFERIKSVEAQKTAILCDDVSQMDALFPAELSVEDEHGRRLIEK